MAYTPINNQAYIAAFAGAIAGMAVSGWITNAALLNYAPSCEVAGAFAQAFDTVWANGAPLNDLENATITAVASQEFNGRGPTADLINPSNWTPAAAGCVALVLQSDVFINGQGISTNPATQLAWYVGGPGASDSNSGHLGSPLATTEEWTRRTCPNGTRLMLTQPEVVLYIAAGIYLNNYFGVGCADENVVQQNPRTLRIVCEKTLSAPITLTGAVNPQAPTIRGQLTSVSTFTSRKRLRLTSGASSGAVAYSTSTANGTSTFVSGFVIPERSAFHVFSGANVGDTCVEETPTVLLRRAEFNVGPYGHIIIENAQIIRATVNGVCSETPSGDAGGNVTFSACDAAGTFSIWQCNSGGANLFACRVTGATVFQGFGWLNWGSICTGLMSVANGSISSYGLTIDGGQLWVNNEANFEYKGNQGASRFTAEQSYNGTGTIEIINGGNASGVGAAINVLTGGQFFNAGRGPTQAEIWGLSTPYALGYNVQPGSYVYQTGALADPTQFNNLGLFACTVNMNIAGTAFAFSTTPRPDPNHNCGVIAGS